MSDNNKAVLTTEIAGVPVELSLTAYDNRIQLKVEKVNGGQQYCGNLFGIGLAEDKTKLTGFLNSAFLGNNQELAKYVELDELGAIAVGGEPTFLPFSDLIVDEVQCDCEYCVGYRAGLEAAGV